MLRPVLTGLALLLASSALAQEVRAPIAYLDPVEAEYLARHKRVMADPLAERGYEPRAGEPLAEGATLLSFEGDAGPEHWLGYRNFFVITRYNRSPMYAMAVHQLAQEIAAGSGGTGR